MDTSRPIADPAPGGGAGRSLVVLLVAGALALAGCVGASSTASSVDRGPSVSLAQATPSPREKVPSALEDPVGSDLPSPIVDPSQIMPGGPPPDGIPAIDHPRFERASTVGWLDDQEPVLALQVGDEARAYPVQILIWHEIVNDTVAGVPVAITYCPLCNTAVAYERDVGSKILDFGTSGRLYDSDLVAYDRQTQSLWVQFLGEAVAGTMTGTTLRSFPVSTVSWQDWRSAHPTGWVLLRETGFSRPYGQNPYPGYDTVGSSPFLFSGPIDHRLPAMARVLGLRSGDEAIAVLLDVLRRRGVVEVSLDDAPVVVWEVPGTSSPLDAPEVAAGRDVGSTGAFSPILGGLNLHFERAGGEFKDLETGSTWNVLGEATAGRLAGRVLSSVRHVDTFWFAWAAFLPRTELVSR